MHLRVGMYANVYLNECTHIHTPAFSGTVATVATTSPPSECSIEIFWPSGRLQGLLWQTKCQRDSCHGQSSLHTLLTMATH